MAREKVSEMVWEFAGEFIALGETIEEKQSRLNAACSAWNIACDPPEVRGKKLDQYTESYRSFNPAADDEEVKAVREDMEKLIENKLRLFPAVNKQILGAQMSQSKGQDRIDVATLRYE